MSDHLPQIIVQYYMGCENAKGIPMKTVTVWGYFNTAITFQCCVHFSCATITNSIAMTWNAVPWWFSASGVGVLSPWEHLAMSGDSLVVQPGRMMSATDTGAAGGAAPPPIRHRTDSHQECPLVGSLEQPWYLKPNLSQTELLLHDSLPDTTHEISWNLYKSYAINIPFSHIKSLRHARTGTSCSRSRPY